MQMTSDWGEKVKSWVAWSREKLPVEGDLPAINSVEFKDAPWMAYIPDMFDVADGPRNESVPNDSCSLPPLFEALLHDPKDIPTRFTALSLSYALAKHPLVDEETFAILHERGFTDQYQAPDERDLFKEFARGELNRARHEQKLEYLVRVRQVEDIGNWKEMRWEILNSYLIHDWARAGKLYDRAEELGRLDINLIRLLRGQFNYVVVFGSRMTQIIRDLFRYPRSPYDDDAYRLESLLWEPKVYERPKVGSPKDCQYAALFLSGIYFSFNDEILLIPPEYRDAIIPDKDLDVYFRYEEMLLGETDPERLRVAALDLERALLDSPNPNRVYRSILAKCYFLIGRYHDAATCYEAVHEAINEEASPRLWSYMCIAISYQRAGELAKAVESLDRCSCEFPKKRSIYLHKARLCAQLGNLQSAHESLLKAVELDSQLGKLLGSAWRLNLQPFQETLMPLTMLFRGS